jgi:hypothetical protein
MVGRAARDPVHARTEPGAAGGSLDASSAAGATEAEQTAIAAAETQTEVATTDGPKTSGVTNEAAPVTVAPPPPHAQPHTAPEPAPQAEGLTQEVKLLRDSIRRLAKPDGESAERIKVLAELRHQIEALCTALKTQQALQENGEARAAELARALEALGDQLGVPR